MYSIKNDTKEKGAEENVCFDREKWKNGKVFRQLARNMENSRKMMNYHKGTNFILVQEEPRIHVTFSFPIQLRLEK